MLGIDDRISKKLFCKILEYGFYYSENEFVSHILDLLKILF